MITQIGKQLATQIVDTVHDVCGHDINFINKNGIIYASTNTSRIGSFHEIGKKAADTKTVIEVQDNDHYEGTSSGVNIPVTHNGYLIAVIWFLICCPEPELPTEPANLSLSQIK